MKTEKTIQVDDLCSACCHERGKHTKEGCKEIVSNEKECDCERFILTE